MIAEADRGPVLAAPRGARQRGRWQGPDEDKTRDRIALEQGQLITSNVLAKDGYPPTSLDTRADVTFQPGPGITGIKLTVTGVVPGITAEQFEAAAQDAKQNCPVSKALTGTTITLEATLAG